MIDILKVRKQLGAVGYHTTSWQKSEVKELCHILRDDEQIVNAVNGHYEGGFALLVATNHRLLLVDHKPMFLTIDSITYAMIQEVSFNYRLFNSTIHVYTSNKCLDFNTWSHTRIRTIFTYSQSRIVQARMMAQDPTMPMLEKRQAQQIQDYMPEFTNTISPGTTGFTPIISFTPQAEEARLLPNEEPEELLIPDMPQPHSSLSKIRGTSNISNLGFSALINAYQDRQLSAYKIPTLAQRRFIKSVS